MGSLCGSAQTTTQSSQTYTPAAASQLQDIWGRIQQAASTPYQAYTGQMVAPLDPTQLAGISGVNAAANAAQPYYNTAAGYAATGAAPISQTDISRYISPYTQSVIDATQRQFADTNKQQQQQIIGNAALKGALGGDRVGVAQAELARQQKMAQDPVIAGLYNNAYTQAIGAAQADRSAAAQGAYSFGALGSGAQGAALQGAGAQLQAGAVPQQNQQQQLTAAYNQYLQSQAFPYQQAQFLASAGLPTLTAMGGSQSGTSTSGQQQSPWGQIAGTALTALSFLKDGGAVHGYADGGPISLLDVPTYIPRVDIQSSQRPQFAAMPSAPSPQMDNSFGSINSGLSNFLGSREFALPQAQGGNYDLNAAANYLIGPTGFMAGGVKRGGRIHDNFAETVQELRKSLRRGYADGGEIEQPATFADRFGAARDAYDSGIFDAQRMPRESFDGVPVTSIPLPQPRPIAAIPVSATAMEPRSQSPYGLPPQLQNLPGGTEQIRLPDNVMAFDATPQSPFAVSAAQPAPSAPATQGSKGLFGLFNGLTDDQRMALRAAGLGMMASRAPNAFGQIGEGGLKGLAAYTEAQKTAAERKQTQQRIDLQAAQLARQAEQFAKTHGLNVEKFEDAKRQRDMDLLKPVKLGVDGLGREIYGIRNRDNTYSIIDSKTGRIIPQDQTPSGNTVPAVPSPVSQNDDDATIPSKAKLVSGEGVVRNMEYLKTLEQLDPGLPGLVKKIADYEINPNSLSIRGGHRERILGFVSKFDPNYDQAFYPARAQAQKEFISGGANSPAGNITSGNTAIQHLGQLALLSEKIGGTNNAWILNKPLNWLNEHQKEWENNPILRQYKSALERYAEEATKFYRGVGGSLTDVERSINNLSAGQGPAARAAAIYQEAELMNSKISALQDRWKNALGGVGGLEGAVKRAGVADFPIIQKKSEDALAFIHDLHSRSGDAVKSASGIRRPAGVPEGSAYSPSRKMWRAPDGKIFNADGTPVQ